MDLLSVLVPYAILREQSGLIFFEDSMNDSQEHRIGLPIMHWAATD